MKRRLVVLVLPLVIASLAGPGSLFGALNIPEIHKVRGDVDTRTGIVAPSTAALATAQALGGTVRWNRFGTVHVLSKDGGFLATGLIGDPVTVAREWILANRALFRLSAAGVNALELVRDSTLAGGSARVLLFGQRVGNLPVMHEGRIKIGIVDGNIFWVSSSSIGDIATIAQPSLSAAQAWLRAAGSLGLSVPALNVTTAGQDGSWTLLQVPGFSHPQRARLVALGMPGAGAIPAWETIVLNVTGQEVLGYTAFVHGATGAVVVGQNRVQQWEEEDGLTSVALPAIAAGGQKTDTYQGEYPPDQASQCGPCHGPFTAAAGESWARIVATAAGANAANDLTLTLFGDAACSRLLETTDLLVGSEALLYQPAGGVTAGNYYLRVCPYNSAQISPTTYTGTLTFASGSDLNTNPKWSFFPATPPLDFSSTDTRILGCWFDELPGGPFLPECQAAFAEASSHSMPWDFNPASNLPSNTTTGNAGRSSEAWGAHLGPGAAYQPVVTSPDPGQQRVYDFPWTNEWFESKCDPTRVVHGGLYNSNDIDAAITNLFVIHNRVHDWVYHLGLRERQGAAQLSNFGQTLATQQQDPELGNAQAGALQGAPAYNGRDNANQLTLNDGIPPMTSMYLWQTIGGAVYVPCVDGDFDAGVIAHEYGHLIQNRMVDPDNGLTGDQGRAMGEGWSDLTAMELLNEYGLVPVANENRYAVGAYATGDFEKGIRNYAMNANPLNYSNVGYDSTCNLAVTDVQGLCPELTQVHSDGEIWSGTNFDLRQALVTKYNSAFPSTSLDLQKRCADGELAVDHCPGNRRWVQILHDAFLLMPSAPSMVDARDAYLAADLARSSDPVLSWPSNQIELWRAFARRGLGQFASSAGTADYDPLPDFSSPHDNNADITFQLVASEELNAPVQGEIYVGRYEARARPVADTNPGTPLGDTRLFSPGTYEFVVRANGYGHFRFTRSFASGQAAIVTVHLPTNWASRFKGASASGEGAGHADLIDDTETTNWEFLDAVPSVNVATPEVTVALPGRRRVTKVQVSGMLELMLGQAEQNRHSSIHAFRILACDGTVSNCALPLGWTTILTSPSDAFPSSSLRPLVPDMLARELNVTATYATHVKLEVLHNKCTGSPNYQGYLGIAGQEDNDPLNGTSCITGAGPLIKPKNDDVRAAELQVFGTNGFVVAANK